MKSSWSETDFDELGWHDSHVHGFRVLEGEHGTGELRLDLDYILEWLCPAGEGGACRFRIAPALLKFRDVTSLRFSLDYATPTAAMGPFSIGGIEREPISYGSGYGSYRWTIPINWPAGEITFESPGFTHMLTGSVVETDSQQLDESQRNGDSPVD